MQEIQELIEDSLTNTDGWKDFIDEAGTDLSNSTLVNLSVEIHDNKARTYYFLASIIYELNEKQHTSEKYGKAVSRKNNTIQSINLT